MDFLILLVLIGAFVFGVKLIIYTLKENISANAYARAEKEILKEKARLAELREYQMTYKK